MRKHEWSEERHLWEMTSNILDNHGDMVDDVHICEHEEFGTEYRKVYCSEGYCFELTRELSWKDEEQTVPADEEGYFYSFCEPWDGFKEAKYEGAVRVLSAYGDVKRK